MRMWQVIRLTILIRRGKLRVGSGKGAELAVEFALRITIEAGEGTFIGNA